MSTLRLTILNRLIYHYLHGILFTRIVSMMSLL